MVSIFDCSNDIEEMIYQFVGVRFFRKRRGRGFKQQAPRIISTNRKFDGWCNVRRSPGYDELHKYQHMKDKRNNLMILQEQLELSTIFDDSPYEHDAAVFHLSQLNILEIEKINRNMEYECLRACEFLDYVPYSIVRSRYVKSKEWEDWQDRICLENREIAEMKQKVEKPSRMCVWIESRYSVAMYLEAHPEHPHMLAKQKGIRPL